MHSPTSRPGEFRRLGAGPMPNELDMSLPRSPPGPDQPGEREAGERWPSGSMRRAWSWQSLRLVQIRALASWLSHLERRPGGQALVVRLRQMGLSPLLNGLLGFRGSFGSLAEAAKAAHRFIPFAHDHPDETMLSLALAEVTRESDYPVLFQLAPIAPRLRRVFDLGGATGNLFYSYDRHLQFSEELVWTVCDLQPQRDAGLAFARERSERRIRFTDKLEEGDGVDLFLVSGALHYFEEPLYPLLSRFRRRPRHVIVNRSPFSRGAALYTVQDARTHLVACKLHGRSQFIQGMRDLGYELRETWPVFELQAWVPLFPEYCDRHYWGFHFALSAESGPP